MVIEPHDDSKQNVHNLNQGMQVDTHMILSKSTAAPTATIGERTQKDIENDNAVNNDVAKLEATNIDTVQQSTSKNTALKRESNKKAIDILFYDPRSLKRKINKKSNGNDHAVCKMEHDVNVDLNLDFGTLKNINNINDIQLGKLVATNIVQQLYDDAIIQKTSQKSTRVLAKLKMSRTHTPIQRKISKNKAKPTTKYASKNSPINPKSRIAKAKLSKSQKPQQTAHINNSVNSSKNTRGATLQCRSNQACKPRLTKSRMKSCVSAARNKVLKNQMKAATNSAASRRCKIKKTKLPKLRRNVKQLKSRKVKVNKNDSIKANCAVENNFMIPLETSESGYCDYPVKTAQIFGKPVEKPSNAYYNYCAEEECAINEIMPEQNYSNNGKYDLATTAPDIKQVQEIYCETLFTCGSDDVTS